MFKPLRAKSSIRLWPHARSSEDRDGHVHVASLEIRCGQRDDPSAVRLLHRNFSYKYVTIQITHDNWRASIPYTIRKKKILRLELKCLHPALRFKACLNPREHGA